MKCLILSIILSMLLLSACSTSPTVTLQWSYPENGSYPEEFYIEKSYDGTVWKHVDTVSSNKVKMTVEEVAYFIRTLGVDKIHRAGPPSPSSDAIQ